MFDTKTPSTLEILEDARLKTRLAELGRRQQETAEGLKDQYQTSDQVEAEQFQFESNEYAADCPPYASARAASANFLVVPLDGTTPLADPSEASREPRKLLAWWQEHPSANPGIALGRVGGVVALKVDDLAAYGRLREMATVECSDEDGRTWKEYRELGGYTGSSS